MQATAWQSECVDEVSNKFYRCYQLETAGKVILHWGRRGTTGQCKIEAVPAGYGAVRHGTDIYWHKHLRGYDDVITNLYFTVPDRVLDSAKISPDDRRSLHEAFNRAVGARRDLAGLVSDLEEAEGSGQLGWGSAGVIVALGGWSNEPRVHPWLGRLAETLAAYAVIDQQHDVALVTMAGPLAQSLRQQWLDAVAFGPGSDSADTAEMATVALGLWDGRDSELASQSGGAFNLGQPPTSRGRFNDSTQLHAAVEGARLILTP